MGPIQERVGDVGSEDRLVPASKHGTGTGQRGIFYVFLATQKMRSNSCAVDSEQSTFDNLLAGYFLWQSFSKPERLIYKFVTCNILINHYVLGLTQLLHYVEALNMV
jgi:hypothetical protein